MRILNKKANLKTHRSNQLRQWSEPSDTVLSEGVFGWCPADAHQLASSLRGLETHEMGDVGFSSTYNAFSYDGRSSEQKSQLFDATVLMKRYKDHPSERPHLMQYDST